MHLRNIRLIRLVLLGVLLLLSLFLLGSGCKRGEAPPLPPPSSSLIGDPAQQDIVETWLGSTHADTYVLSSGGTNNACARCHSPINWLPTDKADLPATCQNCVVPFELSEPDQPVAEADWKSVECDICHVIVKIGDSGTATGGTATSLTDADQNFLTTVTVDMYVYNETDNSYAVVVAVVDDETITTTVLTEGTDNTWAIGDKYDIGYYSAASEVGWLDMLQTMPGEEMVYTAVSSNRELCEKCHRDVDTSLYARDLGQDAHTDKQCTDCHEEHSLEASCASCHEEPLTGHDEEHDIVMCVACHDASGLDAGPVEGEDIWLTFRTDDPYISHNLQLDVDCTRCHFTGNPWDLSVK